MRATALLCSLLVLVAGVAPVAAGGVVTARDGAAATAHVDGAAATADDTPPPINGVPFSCSVTDVVYEPPVNGTVETGNTTLSLLLCDRHRLLVNETHAPTATATVRVGVDNVGAEAANTTLPLDVDGERRNATRVRLDPGNETVATLGVTFSEPGAYTANVSGVGPVAIEVVDRPYRVCEGPFPDRGFSRPGSVPDPCPTDVDADGLYEDVNGDGTVAFDDAISLAFADYGPVNDDPARRAAFDFDGDGDVDFADAVELAFAV